MLILAIFGLLLFPSCRTETCFKSACSSPFTEYCNAVFFCVPLLQIGSRCNSDLQCLSMSCDPVSKSCRSGGNGTSGAPCLNDTYCSEQYYCGQVSTCVKQKAAQSACIYDNECGYYLICSHSICQSNIITSIDYAIFIYILVGPVALILIVSIAVWWRRRSFHKRTTQPSTQDGKNPMAIYPMVEPSAPFSSSSGPPTPNIYPYAAAPPDLVPRPPIRSG